MGKIIQALTTAYKRDHEGVEYVVVDVDEEKKDLKMYVQKEIVEEVENPASQISLEEAKRISAKNELGGMVNFPVESVNSARIAAGNGKQVIIQSMREAEHGMIYDGVGQQAARDPHRHRQPHRPPERQRDPADRQRQRGHGGCADHERAGARRGGCTRGRW